MVHISHACNDCINYFIKYQLNIMFEMLSDRINNNNNKHYFDISVQKCVNTI